uniref:Solute carrier family 66 member 3 n=1 Tax=Sus scrofa TaxID=9823 RepID=A0A4X1UD27_PIG
ARPGIEPATSWLLVGFINHCATTGTPSSFWVFIPLLGPGGLPPPPLGLCGGTRAPGWRPSLPALCQVRSELTCVLPLPRFLVFLRYQSYYEYPLLTYLEYPILLTQGNRAPVPGLSPPGPLLALTRSLSFSDLVLLLCIFHFSGHVERAAFYIALFVSAWFVLSLRKWIMDLAMNFCTFISAASKFAQLQYLWKTRDSGAVSALTWSLASYSCAVRIITTLMTTNDLTILTRFVVTLALNIWVTATILRYRKTAVKAE